MRSVAATAMTFWQLAGTEVDTFVLLLPAATPTVVPRPTAALIAFWYVAEHEPPPPSDMLMTSAGVALAGAPLTVPPDAQVIPSAMSEV